MTQSTTQFVLGHLCDVFARLGALRGTPRSGVFSASEDEPGIDEEDVETALRELDKKGHIEDSRGIGGSVTLYPSGIEEYERMSGEEVVSSDLRRNILDILGDAEHDSARDSFVGQKELLEKTGADETDLKGLKEYLKMTREIEPQNEASSEWEARITNRGKRGTRR